MLRGFDRPERLSEEQRRLHTACVHPTGTFVAFGKHDIEQSIPARFKQQVDQYPDRPAVKDEHQQCTYQELNRFADQVAQALLAQGGEGPEPIGVLLDQGTVTVGALLGVLKAGKIFCTLDPEFPQDRLRFMLEDMQARLLVTDHRHAALADMLMPQESSRLLVDALPESLASADPLPAIAPHDLAYISYSSGSTGQPKGIVHNHRNVLHHVMNYTNVFHLCAAERITLLLSCSFHAAMINMFSALCNGAALHAWNVKQHGLRGLADWLHQEKITVLDWVPTLFRHFAATLTGQETFPHLRLVILGSEAVSTRDAELFRKHFASPCLMANRLGTTETFNFCVSFADQHMPLHGATVPAGYALEDKEVLLLDEDGQQVQGGQVGQIVVRSRHLATEYWRQPELTLAKFRPDLVDPERRLYYTGDLGRLRPDGDLEYLGRQDFQVKIRGQRIETQEIETALLGLETVQEAAVVGGVDGQGEAYLVAYLVPTQRPSPSVTVLRHHLAQTLPASMIPARFVFLDALPLIPSGKVDRRALPAPSHARPKLDMPVTPPGTPIEEALVAIWAEVLGIDAPGIHDPFLELGGDSLLAMQVIARVRTRLQVQLPEHVLFEAPTVADMALVILQSQVEHIDAETLEDLLGEC